MSSHGIDNARTSVGDAACYPKWEEHWKATLDGATPAGFPDAPAQCRFEIKKDLTMSFAALEPKSNNFRARSTTFWTAWAVLLGRYSGSKDTTIGVVSAAQMNRDVETPGKNVLPLRANLVEKETLHDLLNSVDEQMCAAQDTEFLAHGKIKDLGAEFFALCNFQHVFIEGGLASPAVYDQALMKMIESGQFGFIVEHRFEADNIQMTLRYDDKHVDDQQVQRICAHFTYLYGQLILDGSEKTVSDLEFLTPQDRAEICSWNTRNPTVMENCAHELFVEQARINPQATAISSWDGDMSYDELQSLAEQLANYLKTVGVGKETVVPICFEKSKWAIVALLGILKAGGACSFLDITHPVDRLAFIVKDLDAKIILTSSALRSGLDPLNLETLVISPSFFVDRSSIIEITPSDVKPHNKAFVIYTSGSTGNPKGVIVEHRSVCTSLRTHAQFLNLGLGTRMMQFAAYTFDIAYGDIFTALMCGGCVCIPSETDRINNLSKSFNDLKANTVHLTPTVAKLLSPDEIPTLKTLIVGGEAIPKRVLETWADKVNLVNFYGPAECTVDCVAQAHLSKTDVPGIIGRGLGARTWITDPGCPGQLAPIGAVGELIIEGAVVARGYLNDEDKTRTSFIDIPASIADLMAGYDNGRKELKLYRTGDMVQYLSDGSIRYRGRKDHQVKLRGQRIELGEVELHIQRHMPPNVDVVAGIVTLQGAEGSPSLAAFVAVGADDGDFHHSVIPKTDATRLRMRNLTGDIEPKLSLALPPYMIPTLFIPVSFMPQSGSNKVDRKKLNAMASKLSTKDLALLTGPLDRRMPVGQMEQALQSIWSELLQVSPEFISAEDNFLRLGGDSVSAIQMVAAARGKKISLTVNDIFVAPKLSDLAKRAKDYDSKSKLHVKPFALLEAQHVAQIIDDACAQCNVEIKEISDCYPPTSLQTGLMALSVREDNRAYVFQYVFTVPGNLDVKKFQEAWTQVALAVPTLRSRFIYTTSSGFSQVILKSPPRWTQSTGLGLTGYLDEDHKAHMGLGQALNRFAIVQNAEDSLERYFVWTLHHATFDRWSLAGVLRRVEQSYLQQPMDPVVDFNVFLGYMRNCDLESSKHFWREQLREAPVPTFPQGRNNSARALSNSTLELTVPFIRSTYLELTRATFLRAAWAILVAKYEESASDVVFGTTLSGRNASLEDTHLIMGPTFTTMPIRISFKPGQTVESFLLGVQKQSTEMIPHEHFGLQEIGKLNPDTQAACNFRNLLVIQTQDEAADTKSFLGLQKKGEYDEGALTYPLTVACTLKEDSVSLLAKHDSSILDTSSVERILGQFGHIICQLASATGGEKLEALNMTRPEDINQVLGWNSEFPKTYEECIHQLVEQRATLYPDAVAVTSWDLQKDWTYKDLDGIAFGVAETLLDAGLSMEDKVPVCFDKSAWTIAAMLGVLKAGGVCVAIDPKHPPERVQEILNTTSAKVVLCSEEYGKRFSKIVPSVVCLGSTWPSRYAANRIKRQQQSMALPDVSPSQASFIVFTSGSTGKPKGIVLEHQSLCTSAREHGSVMRVNAQSRVLQFAAYTFDVSIGEIFTTLIHGGCICVPSESDRMDDLAGFINRKHVNWAYLTPSVASLLKPADVRKTLKTLSLGGEAVRQDNVEAWANEVYLINIYGPAECSIWSTALPSLRKHTPAANIGRGVGALMWITDIGNHDKLCPVGCVGELLIEGPILAREYLNDETRTASSFVSNPAWSRGVLEQPRRMYKTGDLVRYDTDGNILYVGRRDNQVKIHGQRVEMAEVEHQIKIRSEIDIEVAVDLAKLGGSGDSILAAFISTAYPEIDTSPDTALFMAMTPDISEQFAALQTSLSDSLPAYMIPSAYFPVSTLPKMTSGKTDRKMLRLEASHLTPNALAPYMSLSSSETRQPSSTVEKQLQSLWSRTLHLPLSSINANSNFFKLGADSIASMRLVAMAKEDGLSFAVSTIFSHPRLCDLATQALACGTVERDISLSSDRFHLLGDDDSVKIILQNLRSKYDLGDIEDCFPCTPLQQALFALSLKQPGTYVSQDVFELPKNFDTARFRKAWETVAQNSPIIRTAIVLVESVGALQVIINRNPKWHTAGSLDAYLELQSQTPVEFGQLLSQYSIIGEPSNPKYFVWSAHHSMYDGWSKKIIIDKVSKAYSGLSIQRPPPFSNFIKHLQTLDVNASNSFWSRQLQGCSSHHFPELKSAGSALPRRNGNYTCEYPFVSTLDSETTPSTIIRAAWGFLMSRHLNADDVVFGEILTGRSAPVPGILDIEAPTLTVVPTRMIVDNSQRISDFLRAFQQQTVSTTPFEQAGLLDISRLSDDCRNACQFQNLLVIQPDEVSTIMGLSRTQTTNSSFHSYPLAVECGLSNGKLSIKITVDQNILPLGQAGRLARQLAHLVGQLTRPEMKFMRVGDLVALSPEDLDEITTQNILVPNGIDKPVPHVISQRASETPSATAICSWDQDLTYSELEKVTTSLALKLVSLGVSSGDFIPVCFEKSTWAIVSMLAIAKAGAAFLPLDPSHPQSRLSLIVEDVGAKLALVSPTSQNLISDTVQTFVISDDILGHESRTPSGTEICNRATGSNEVREGLPCLSLEDPMYIIFTSGSTGKPKGVVIQHKAAASGMYYHGAAAGFDSKTRMLQFASYAFDATIMEVFTTLFCGGCVCVPSEDEKMNDISLAINRMQVTMTCLTPSVASVIQPAQVKSINCLLMGGEPGRADVIERWTKYKDVRMMNLYGPTEACVVASGKTLSKYSDPRDIGTTCGCVPWIVEPDNHHRLAPFGAVGELLLQGPTLALGYYKDNIKTEAAFFLDPPWAPGSKLGQRFYKTGDLVRYNDDGSLKIIGRKDTQFKLNGQRIELGEIEVVLRSCVPDNAESAIQPLSRGTIEKFQFIVAYIVIDIEAEDAKKSSVLPLSQQTAAMLSSVKKSMTDRLPAHMIPAVWLPLRKLPLTTSGKIDRRMLLSFANELSQEEWSLYTLTAKSATSTRRPQTFEELELSALWSKVLGISSDRIGLDDGFFALGGDSVRAMQLAAFARERKLSLTVADIFRYSHLLEMSAKVERLEKDVSTASEPYELIGGIDQGILLKERIATDFDLPASLLEDAYPTTPLQQGLFALSLKDTSYVSYFVFQIPDSIDLFRFRSAWKQTVEANAVLRTRMVYHQGRLLQLVFGNSFQWEVVGRQDIASFLDEEKSIKTGVGACLSRFAILSETTSRQRYFIWTCHHALYDGWSIRRIMAQVEAAYHDGMDGFDLPKSQFSSFIKYIEQSDSAKALRFWLDKMTDATVPSFPSLPKVDYQPNPNSHLEEKFGFRRDHPSLTTPTLIQGAWALLLSQYEGSEDVVFGMTVSGRSAPVNGINEITGPTFSTIPVRTRILAAEPVQAYLARIQDESTESIPFEYFGLQNIIRTTNSAACNFRCLVVIQTSTNTSEQTLLNLPKVSHGSKPIQTYPLILECSFSPTEIRFNASFDSKIIDAQQMRRLLGQLRHILEQLNAAPPEEKLSEIEMVPATDMEKIRQWNSRMPNEIQECLHDIVQRTVHSKPQACAVRGWDADFSYKELDVLSSRLAWHLSHNLSIGPETLVPICFEKSSWAIVAMLAVMKAGGAFVPLDPAHPSTRLRSLVEETGAKLILASQETLGRLHDLEEEHFVVSSQSIAEIPLETATFMSDIGPRHPAYVIFTSGSTGKPKGVVMSHSAACSSIMDHGTVLQYSEARVLQFASYTFDASIAEIFTTLCHGGCVCVPSDDQRNNIPLAVSSLEVSHIFATPSLLRLFKPEDVPSVNTVLLGGEALGQDNVEIWSEKVDLFLMYGPTETCIYQSSHKAAIDSRPSSIGRHLGSLSWIVEPNNHNRLVPIGAIGELVIQGPTLARGYLNDVSKTSSAFVESPGWLRDKTAVSNRYTRIYKSGDLVRYNSDGSIDIIGRKDSQIKLNGQRIELGEIEHTIQRMGQNYGQFTVQIVSLKGSLLILNRNSLLQPRKIVGWFTFRSFIENCYRNCNNLWRAFYLSIWSLQCSFL